jgi:hypothetical protein
MKITSVRPLTTFAILVAALHLHAATLVTRFNTDPLAGGWQIHGTNDLFAWNSGDQNLEVTWDSSKPNNLFFLPLGATYARTNDFLVAFELNLNDIAVGTTPDYLYSFEIAVGLVNLQQATNAGFVRGSGFQAPNLIEWDYFPNDINNFGATVATTVISSNNAYGNGGFTFPLELATNATYAIRMTYTAADATLRSQMTSNGVPVGPLQNAWLGDSFDDFAVNALAIISYNDEGQFPGFEGSVLAHGTVDNVVFASPLPVQTITNISATEISLASDAAWNYTLECTTNLVDWTQAAPTVPGHGGTLVLQATNAPAVHGFYRVRADLP